MKSLVLAVMLARGMASTDPLAVLLTSSPSGFRSVGPRPGSRSLQAFAPQSPAARRASATLQADPATLISAKSDEEQAAAVKTIYTGIVGASGVLWLLLTLLEGVFPEGLFGTLGNAQAVPLGLLYMAIGAAHFLQKEMFFPIVPPRGTWGGWWDIPSPGKGSIFEKLSYAEFHTFWTGAMEIAGGFLLVASSIGLFPNAVQRFDAFLLFVLTVALTPANIYMYTHDVQMGGDAPPMKHPDSHYVRAALQVVLLADFAKLMTR